MNIVYISLYIEPRIYNYSKTDKYDKSIRVLVL